MLKKKTALHTYPASCVATDLGQREKHQVFIIRGYYGREVRPVVSVVVDIEVISIPSGLLGDVTNSINFMDVIDLFFQTAGRLLFLDNYF